MGGGFGDWSKRKKPEHVYIAKFVKLECMKLKKG